MTIDTDEWMLPHHDSPLVTFENKERVTLGHRKLTKRNSLLSYILRDAQAYTHLDHYGDFTFDVMDFIVS